VFEEDITDFFEEDITDFFEYLIAVDVCSCILDNSVIFSQQMLNIY
jgi:hypothetical protein